jgi:hypothetical protein
MVNIGNPKSYIISDKINTRVQADSCIGTSVEEASLFRLSLPTLHPVVENR